MESQPNDLKDLAVEAFVYGYPLVEQGKLFFSMVAGKNPLSAPVNTFHHVRTVFDAKTARAVGIVSPNNDTMYSVALVDVGSEPVVLRVPEVGDRYYVLQHLDLWTNNFAYVGRRTNGGQPGEYLLSGPGWQGVAPAGMTVIRAPTSVFIIAGRFLVNGQADIPNVAKLQEATVMVPLSQYPNPPDLASRRIGDTPMPQSNAQVPEALGFWEMLRTLINAYPPHPDDIAYQQRFAPLGVLAAETPYMDADASLSAALQEGEEQGRALIEEQSKTAFPLRNRWTAVPEMFNYNVHFLEFGTIDALEWKITDPKRNRLTRAIAARVGLAGNHAYEAFYPMTFLDADGKQLNGANSYVLHFDSPPPVDAFWSVTMYDVPAFLLVDNPLNRYAIGDRTEGLKLNPDGSLDIYIQKDSPGSAEESNWLPAPTGDFRPILRMYNPRSEAFDDSRWRLPAIEKQD